MTSENFTPWFTEPRLVHMPCGSLLVMDNAPYHTERAEDAFPTPKTSKAPLRPWLPTYHPQVYREDMLNPELSERGKPRCPPPPFRLNLIAEAAGHPMVRTPQYHPELQPMETAWALVKDSCAARCDDPLAGLKTHLEAGFDEVTPAVCQSLIQKVRAQEHQYGVEDEEDDDRE